MADVKFQLRCFEIVIIVKEVSSHAALEPGNVSMR